MNDSGFAVPPLPLALFPLSRFAGEGWGEGKHSEASRKRALTLPSPAKREREKKKRESGKSVSASLEAMNSRDDSDDARLFRESIGRVRPLRQEDAHAPPRPRPPPRAAQAEQDEARVREELLVHAIDPAAIEVGDEIHYLKSGQPPRILKQLRRGHFSVRAELDLHEMTVPVAREAVRDFLDDAIARGEYCVRIVHGKGLRSRGDGPVLKRMTATLLARRKDVLAYASARPAQGGTGAVIVLLARA